MPENKSVEEVLFKTLGTDETINQVLRSDPDGLLIVTNFRVVWVSIQGKSISHVSN